MKKKIVFAVLAGMMVVSACACGKENGSGTVAHNVSKESSNATS